MADLGRITEFYYKIEDKWFDLLDWLEAHDIPAYKLVDPLEKRGIPSLPVFVAILLVILYFVLSALLGGGINLGGGGNFTLIDTGTGSCVTNANLKFSGDGGDLETNTDANCNADVNLPSGDYSLEVTKDGCTKTTAQVTLTDPPNRVEVSMSCGSASDLVSLCFDPASGLGQVSAVEYDGSGDYLRTINNCGTNGCEFFVADNMSYKFKTSSSFESDDNYTSDQLKTASDSEVCLSVSKVGVAGLASGNVMVRVKNTLGAYVQNVRVKLLDSTSMAQIASSLTGSTQSTSGIAYFSVTVGDKFIINVEAGTSTPPYFGSTEYTTTEDPQQIDITLSFGNTSKLTVLNSSDSAPLTGVFITLFELNDINKTTTSTGYNGTASVGLKPGMSYRTTFWKPGYKYFEDAISAGEDKTFYMAAEDDEKVGSIDVGVFFEDNDLPVDGATVTLKKNGKATGYPSGLTVNGATSFEYVEPGDYCVIASRPHGNSSECVPVTVTAGQTTSVTITLEQIMYKISVLAKRMSGTPLRNVSIIVSDELGMFLSGETNFAGKTNFTIPETNMGVKVSGLFKNATDVFDVGQTLGRVAEDKQVILTMEPSDNTVLLDPIIQDSQGNSITLAGATLQAGKTYKFLFSLGIHDVQGQRPESITFSLNDPKEYVEFLPVASDLSEWLSLAPGQTTSTLQYVARGNFVTGTRESISVPVRVKQVFSGTINTNFTFDALWVNSSTEVRDPTTGEHLAIFYIKSGNCKQFGDFGVCKYVYNSTIAPQDPNQFSTTLLQSITLGYEITNEGQPFTGNIVVDDTNLNLNFRDLSGTELTNISLTTASGTSVLQKILNYQMEDHKVTVFSSGFASSLTLQHGDMLKILAAALVVSPPRSFITVSAGGSYLDNISFDILGTITPLLEFEMPEGSNYPASQATLYDLNGIVKFHFNESESKLGINKGRIVIGGSAMSSISGPGLVCTTPLLLSNPTYIWHQGIDDLNTPDFTATFDKNCYLNHTSADSKVSFSLIKPLDNIKEVSWTVPVEKCLQFPDKPSITVYPKTSCTINFVYGQNNPSFVPPQSSDGVCDDEHPATINVKSCDALLPELSVNVQMKKGNSVFGTTSVAEDGASMTYEWKTSLFSTRSETLNVIVNATTEYGSNQFESDYTVPIGFTIIKNPGETTGSCTFFPLKTSQLIRKYTDTGFDCSGQYACNLEQILRYVNDRLPSSGTTTLTANMVGQVDINAQTIATLFKDIPTANSKTVISATPSYSGSGYDYVIDDTSALGFGANSITMEKKASTGKTVITFVNQPTPRDISTVHLDVLDQQVVGTLGDDVIRKLKSDVKVDPSVTDTTILDKLKDVIKTIYGDPTYSYSITAPSISLLQAEICDETKISNPNDPICGSLGAITGQYGSAIYEEPIGNGAFVIHFAVNSSSIFDPVQGLGALIVDFKEAAADPTKSKLVVSTDGTYLAVAPPECILPGNGGATLCECTPGTTSADGKKCRADCMYAKALDLAALYIGNVTIYNYADMTGFTSTYFNTSASLDLKGYDGGSTIKVAETDTDGMSEVVVLNYSGLNDKQSIFIFGKTNGVLTLRKTILLDSIQAVDFAIMNWDATSGPDLLLLKENNIVWVFSDISKIIAGSTLSASSTHTPFTLQGTDDYDLIKAVYLDGSQNLVALRASGYGREYASRFMYDIGAWDTCNVALYKAGNSVASKYFTFKTNEESVRCVDFDFADWMGDGKKEIVILTRKAGSYYEGLNTIFICNLTSLTNSATKKLARDSDDVDCTAMLPSYDLYAYNLAVEDMDGNGKDEILVGSTKDRNIYSYENTQNTLIGKKIGDPSTYLLKIIQPFSNGAANIIDYYPIDWTDLKIPKIA